MGFESVLGDAERAVSAEADAFELATCDLAADCVFGLTQSTSDFSDREETLGEGRHLPAVSEKPARALVS